MMQKNVLKVEGMSCHHCVNSIQKAVGSLAGVSKVDVSLTDKTVSVVYEDGEVSLDNIKKTIDDQGYDVK
ncbi:MAG: Copper chaperone CopZ [Candidatus Dichloromethanomonas elyunquensis]|nr:MAG: Copper chaperone CopZ [Candidatus Dichloromethanomonas elyunquensis]